MNLLRSAFSLIRFFTVTLVSGSHLGLRSESTTSSKSSVKTHGLFSRFLFLRHLRSLAIVLLIIYIGGEVLASNANGVCVGWSCDVAYCPDGYAIQVPDKGLLPCENFDEYIETENQGLLR